MGWHWGILASSGGAAGAFDLLQTTLISSNTASVTFSSLGAYSDYKHLQIRATGRSNRAATQDALQMQFNSDTGNNYARHSLRGDGAVVSSNATTATNYVQFMVLPGTSDTQTNAFDSAIVDILDFSNTSKNTTIRALQGKVGTVPQIQLHSGFWNNTSAVTSITLTTLTGQIIAGSRFSLYGVK